MTEYERELAERAVNALESIAASVAGYRIAEPSAPATEEVQTPEAPTEISLSDARAIVSDYIADHGPGDILKAFGELGHEKLSDLSEDERTELCTNIEYRQEEEANG